MNAVAWGKGTMAPLTQEPWVAALTGHDTRAARLPLQSLVSDGIGAMWRAGSPPAQRRRNEACAVPAAKR